MANLAAIYRQAILKLREAGVATPELDAKILLTAALGMEPNVIITQSERVITSAEYRRIRRLVTRRLQREPVARILGHREFWSLDFALNAATLDPRPDSEIIVSLALETLQENHALRICDLGTGSGCLLLAILSERPNATGLGVDRSVDALRQAQQNAKRLGLANRARFRYSNWLNGIKEQFDLIVANPPYIPTDTIGALQPEIAFDPILALDGGDDGLAAYPAILVDLSKHLKPGGAAIFEIGDNQCEAITAFLPSYGLKLARISLDLAGKARALLIKPEVQSQN